MDIPDDVVEAAAEVIHREVTWATGDDSKRIARAALAAASGPLAEQLDAANARLAAVKKINEGLAEGSESYRKSWEREFRLRTELTKALDAALARNAELEEAKSWAVEKGIKFRAERDALRAELDNLKAQLSEYESSITWGTSCLSCSKTLDSSYAEYVRAEKAHAELDNLRESLTQIEGWHHAGLWNASCPGRPTNLHWTRPGQLEAKCGLCGFALVAMDTDGNAIVRGSDDE